MTSNETIEALRMENKSLRIIVSELRIDKATHQKAAHYWLIQYVHAQWKAHPLNTSPLKRWEYKKQKGKPKK
ncbi:MAG: hypothetical protein F4010_03610 [Cenarchaeum sp. SB0669_bin_11]|nr:hypothetical protein [Cenarchaeum sp. SB0669_bin_11]